MIKGDAVKRRNAAIMAVIITVILSGALGCGEEEEYAQEPRIEQNIITYETLRKWDILVNEGVGMELLVSPSATKQEVMTLARHLKSKYRSRNKYVWVNIFDSKIAYLRRDDMSYPQAEYWKHFLVQVNLSNEVMWVAKGRANKNISTDPRLKQIQILLRKWGLATGPADGLLGEKTRRAIRNYQELKGLPITGAPSDELLKHIENTINATPK